MYQFRRILAMDTKNLFTNPMWIFFSIGFPLLLVMILGFLTSGSYGAQITSYDFYSVTCLIYCALNTAVLAANAFMEVRIKSPSMRIIHAPIPDFFLYLSKILATFIFATVCYSFLAVILRLFFKANFGGTAIPKLFLLLLALEFFFACFGIMMCCILKSEESVNQVVSNAITLLALLGGLFFPVEGFGNAVRILSNFSPVKWVATVTFQIIYDHNYTLFLPTIFGLLGLSILWIALCKHFFHKEDYL